MPPLFRHAPRPGAEARGGGPGRGRPARPVVDDRGPGGGPRGRPDGIRPPPGRRGGRSAVGRRTRFSGREPPRNSGLRKWLTYAVVAFVLVTCALLLRRELMNSFMSDMQPTALRPLSRENFSRSPDAGSAPVNAAEPILVNIAYGTEKKKWLEPALRELSQDPGGPGHSHQPSRHGLDRGGECSPRRAQAGGATPPADPRLVAGQQRLPRRARDRVEGQARRRARFSPPRTSHSRPMVFVFWKPRYDAFVKAFGTVNFRTLGRGDEGTGRLGEDRPPAGVGPLQVRPHRPEHVQQRPPGSCADGLRIRRQATRADRRRHRRETVPGLAMGVRARDHPARQLSRPTAPALSWRRWCSAAPPSTTAWWLYENLAIDYMEAAIQRWGTEGEFYVVYPDPNALERAPVLHPRRPLERRPAAEKPPPTSSSS